MDKHHIKGFETITYFGDGLWDFKTTQKLEINFIGVDSKNNGYLKDNGAKQVIKDFIEPEKILNWIRSARG